MHLVIFPMFRFMRAIDQDRTKVYEKRILKIFILDQTPIFPSYSTFHFLISDLSYGFPHLVALSSNFCFVSQAQLSSHNSVISCLWITDRWLLSCASETKIRWQRHQVWKFTNNICKSKILLKKCSLRPTKFIAGF